jgi:predicted GNAT family N-acyltransferase
MMLAMKMRRAEYGSSEYQVCLELRRVVLREPLGLEWTEADLAGEEEEWQMGWWEEEALTACLSIHWLGGGVVKLRQMAVRGDRQGEGLGRLLVTAVLDLLGQEGVREAELHAREPVVGFYEKLGFERVGEQFEEVGLAHWGMKRQI